jgi:hypothetical protein
MWGQGSGHGGGQQHHHSQQPHYPPGPSSQAGPSRDGGDGPALARVHDKWPDILVVNLSVLRQLLGADLVRFRELLNEIQFREVKLRALDRSEPFQRVKQSCTKEHGLILALAIAGEMRMMRCNHCQHNDSEARTPVFHDCRRMHGLLDGACGNCILDGKKDSCSYC